MANMEIGQIVDFIEEYNRMHDTKQKASGKKDKEETTIRKATQADWDAFLG